jgi:hypothetical protein
MAPLSLEVVKSLSLAEPLLFSFSDAELKFLIKFLHDPHIAFLLLFLAICRIHAGLVLLKLCLAN